MIGKKLPVAPFEDVLIVKVVEPDPVTVVGLKLAVTPDGSPETLKGTTPLNPFMLVIEAPNVVLLPAATLRESGVTVNEKSCPKANDAPSRAQRRQALISRTSAQ
jgi:hypothetical protein